MTQAVEEPEELQWQLPTCPKCGVTPRMIVRAINLPTRYEPCGHQDFTSELKEGNAMPFL